ncbi:hypothetical protein ABZ371_29780 [Streptomyces sp. NPDC005899]
MRDVVGLVGVETPAKKLPAAPRFAALPRAPAGRPASTEPAPRPEPV